MTSTRAQGLEAPQRADPLRARVARRLLALGAAAKRFIVRILLPEASASESDPLIGDIVDEYPVLVYFSDTTSRLYQIVQWLPVVEILTARHPVAVVTRRRKTTSQLRELTSVPVIYCPTIETLLGLYEYVQAKVILYPNNGVRNFQSLIYRDGLHIHVNHGESDKDSMVSNQAKGYDYVVVAGELARERYRRALICFDTDRLVVCGRPQLDLEVPAALPGRPGQQTILYAPTWWGEHEGNNYTSLDLYGPQIVGAVLARPDTRLVYRPHPRVVAASTGPVARAHQRILTMIADSGRDGVPPAHHYAPEGDILSLFDGADLLLSDISSVALDFLYRRVEAPIVLTDRRTDRDRLASDAPLSAATDVIDATSVHDIGAVIDANLRDDPHLRERTALRERYFGFARGESTRRFTEFVAEAIRRRDELVTTRPRPGTSHTP